MTRQAERCGNSTWQSADGEARLEALAEAFLWLKERAVSEGLMRVNEPEC